VTRVPEAPTRRARATSSNSAPRPSLERFGPRLALSTSVERGMRKPSRASRGSQALDAATHRRANATGIGWCRRAAGREPHSRAKIGGSPGVPARRYRLQKSASDAETQRSATPLATDRVNGGRARTDPRGPARAKGRRRPASRWPHRGAGTRPEPGARKGVAGRRLSIDGRHLGSFLQHASFTRARRRRPRRLWRRPIRARAQ